MEMVLLIQHFKFHKYIGNIVSSSVFDNPLFPKNNSMNFFVLGFLKLFIILLYKFNNSFAGNLIDEYISFK